MLIIPAIDLRKGHCVRLIQGDPNQQTVYSKQPVSMARWWQSQGAKRLHVVDLDGAFEGRIANLETIKDIVKSVKIPVQVGGGIRDIGMIEELFHAGVDSVILGTSVCKNKRFLKKALKEFPGKIIVGIDSKNDYVAISGWKKLTKIKTLDLVNEVELMGVKTIIYTDISRDGMLKGPNFYSIKELLQSSTISLIASGGISDLADIKKLKEIESERLVGAIVGKALYSGKINLAEAIKIGKRC
ncbi:MAG: 1-(5-phosphoribosyl)-5-[(5-phosphoribosylamino)methylideneamino]imidazole-4-carboxamide isomerase [bacterium]|nr:1-(5-phosphoribosyl)-5-[(5-phosphoribosylamino)methylideneamino]imidazole-4-carboxamide isomerase [bacterium]